jgi:hypothetical protein
MGQSHDVRNDPHRHGHMRRLLPQARQELHQGQEDKLRDRALGRAKELVHMGAHGADKLLEDVQTYHNMHNEIVVQKMHQITPPRTWGRYAERPCSNQQCAEGTKPRHIAVGFSSSKQKTTIISENEAREPSPNPSAASSTTLGIDGEARRSGWPSV